jgi:hypothetical protein
MALGRWMEVRAPVQVRPLAPAPEVPRTPAEPMDLALAALPEAQLAKAEALQATLLDQASQCLRHSRGAQEAPRPRHHHPRHHQLRLEAAQWAQVRPPELPP